jgi:hypothetical protein
MIIEKKGMMNDRNLNEYLIVLQDDSGIYSPRIQKTFDVQDDFFAQVQTTSAK